MSDEIIVTDSDLAKKYGTYASYQTESSPVTVDYYGENPNHEIQRLLDIYLKPDSQVLDIGCGAGFTLCRIAPKISAGWGIDENIELLDAARQRAKQQELSNIFLVEGNAAVASDVDQLPDSTFDVAFSERGPGINPFFQHKLKQGAIFIQELVGNFDCYPLKEIFGRRNYAIYNYTDQEVILSQYAEMNLFPVSIKEYFYDEFFRDADHLAGALSVGANLSNWRLPDKPYDADQDRAALALYAQYNQTPSGIRLLRQRKIFVLRHAPVTYYPVDSPIYKER